MSPAAKKPGRPSRSVRDAHRAWLELVETEGPFIALPVLTKAFPTAIPQLDPARRLALTAAKPAFERARDTYDEAPDREAALPTYRAARDAWVETVLRDVLGWGKFWTPGDAVTATTVWSPDRSVEVRATGALRRKDDVGALVWIIDPVSGLREADTDGWSDNPIDRMELLLREAGLPIGVVTDGRWWGLVSAPKDTLAASGVVDAQTWVEEPEVRDAFVELLAPGRLLGKKAEERLSTLFADSVLAAEQITEALGAQVRRAVELVVAALDESAVDTRHRGEPDPLPEDGDEIYAAIVTVLMRVVFLLFAEERGLLPTGELYSMGYGLSDQRELLEKRQLDENAEALDATSLTWHRLLATSKALYAGATFEDLRLPAYGGSLFGPARFPFLTATTERGSLALTVSDRVMLEVLRAVQTATIDGELRRISFRDIDVEQIGYIYEGLLGYTCRRAPEVTIGLPGKEGSEPEIPLRELEDLYERAGSDAALGKELVAWIKEHQPGAKGRTAPQYAKLAATGDAMADAMQAVRSVTTDEELGRRLQDWIGLIRRDLRGRPVVALEGGLLVVETPSRKNAGAHYTPRALAEEVVLHALEPIVYAPGPHQTSDRDAWGLKSSTEILDLKVADIACGSGAFLVAAARYLAARLQEAWQAEGIWTDQPLAERKTKALRAVVAHCLYGADINGMAVEMCKLSLWLVSLDRNLPFSFVDDKVLHGNSLLGLTSLRQLEELHINPKPRPMHEQIGMEFSGNELVQRLDVSHRIQRAISLRQALASEIDDGDPMRSAATKRNQMRQLAEITAELRTVADGVVAAGLALGGKPGKKLDEAYENLRHAVGQAMPVDESPGDSEWLDRIVDQGLTPTVVTDYDRWQPLHWCLEVPDVMQHGGFDAVIGNPPFLGGTKLSGALGGNLRDWFVHQISRSTPGHVDLVAYFLLRAAALAQASGAIGLIATNSIAQGDTRMVGLAHLLDGGFTITRSIQSRPWPAATASLEFAGVWGAPHALVDGVTRTADGVQVAKINSLLEPAGRIDGAALRLKENSSRAFLGCYLLGTGFLVDEPKAREWINANPENSAILRPYLSGEGLNSSVQFNDLPWVVDFNERGQSECEYFDEPWLHLCREVRPGRLAKNAEKYPRMVNEWWKYWNTRPALRAAIEPLEHVIVQARVSRTLVPLLLENRFVFNEKLVVFATDSFADLAVLTSSIHQLWVVKYGTTLRADPTYTPKTCFEPFPRPCATVVLNEVGRSLHERRSEVMLRRKLGLTKLYNLVNDPGYNDTDIALLRQMHVEIDHSVMAAYGWEDVSLDHGFHTYRQMRRWTVSPEARVEILDRLLEENHRRAALQGDAPPPAEDEVDDTEGGE